MRFGVCLVLLLAACRDDAAMVVHVEQPAAPTIEAPVSGDPLLASARVEVSRGLLGASARARIDASDAPLHARAKVLLAALDVGRPVVPPPPPDPSPPATAIAVAAPPQVAEVAVPVRAIESAAAPAPLESRKPVATTLEKLSLRGSSSKATLAIDAGRGMVVGVAAQPGAGLVRLVIKDVRASAAVLAARPRAGGARVVDVDAGPSSVRITLALDEGWRVVTTKRTAKGASIELAPV